MATTSGTVTVLPAAGAAVTSGTVVVSPAAGAATDSGTVTVTNPPQYAQVWNGTALIPIRVGVYNGSTIDWLSPAL